MVFLSLNEIAQIKLSLTVNADLSRSSKTRGLVSTWELGLLSLQLIAMEGARNYTRSLFSQRELNYELGLLRCCAKHSTH